MKKTCPSCGSSNISSDAKEQEFIYGVAPDAVKLSALVTVFTCSDCQFEYTDSSAERAKDAIIRDYLRKQINGTQHE